MHSAELKYGIAGLWKHHLRLVFVVSCVMSDAGLPRIWKVVRMLVRESLGRQRIICRRAGPMCGSDDNRRKDQRADDGESRCPPHHAKDPVSDHHPPPLRTRNAISS